MPAVTMPARQKSDFLADYEERVFAESVAQKHEAAFFI